MEVNSKTIEFECSCVVGDELWFSARDFNGLFKGNLQTGQVSFVAFFPNEVFARIRIHEEIIRYKNKLYCITRSVTHFHVYDMETGEMETYKIQGTVMDKSYRAYLNGGKLYFIPHKVREMIIFNQEQGQISYRNLALEDSLQKSFICQEGNVYGTLENSNILVEINLDNDTVRQISISEKDNRYLLLGVRGDILYLRNNICQEILLWNIKSEKIIARHIVKASIFTDALQMDDCVMVNTYFGNGVQEIDLAKVNNKIHKKDINETKQIPLSSYELLNMFVYQDELWYVWGGDGAIYNGRTHQYLMKFIMDDEVIGQMRKKAIDHKDRGNNETYFFSVAEYAKWLEKNLSML